MKLDTKTRQRIKTFLQYDEGYAVIPLPEGDRLLLAARDGLLIYALLDRAGDFGPNEIQDVTLRVMADLRGGWIP